MILITTPLVCDAYIGDMDDVQNDIQTVGKKMLSSRYTALNIVAKTVLFLRSWGHCSRGGSCRGINSWMVVRGLGWDDSDV